MSSADTRLFDLPDDASILSSASLVTPTENRVRYLIGRKPLDEFLSFAVVETTDSALDRRTLVETWRRASAFIEALPAAARAVGGESLCLPLPRKFEEHPAIVQALPVDPMGDVVPTEIRLVDLTQVCAYQKRVNLSYVAAMLSSFDVDPTGPELIDLCFPRVGTEPRVSVGRSAPNAFSFMSHSSDLRFLDATYVPAEQVDRSGTSIGAVVISVGYGRNCLTAVDIEGRLVLTNGTHRAVALLARGLTIVPCAVQSLSRRDELNLVATNDLAQNPGWFVDEPRPPMLMDFLTPDLYRDYAVRQTAKHIRVSFAVEQSTIVVG